MRLLTIPGRTGDVGPALRSSMFDFSVPGVLPAGATFSRASVGTYTNSLGLMQTAVADEPRFGYEPTGRVNYSFNSEFEVVSGTFPKWFLASTGGGLTSSIVASGKDSLGRSYVDLRLQGTSSYNPAYAYVYFNPQSGAGATRVNSGQTWTFSVDARIVAGSVTGLFPGRPAVGARYVSSTESYIGETNTTLITSGVQARTFVMPAGGNQLSGILNRVVPLGNYVDITIRLKQPQLELGSVATSYIPSRLDGIGIETKYCGILIEPATTNLLPTAVPVLAGGGNASQVLGIDDPAGGTSAIRVVCNGGVDPIAPIFNIPTGNPSGRTFTGTMYLRDYAMYGQASKANILEYGSTGTESPNILTVNTGPSWQRYAKTRTFPAGMVSTTAVWRLDPFDGGTNQPVADSSQDTAFWQYEEKPFATSYIPPGVTRFADVLMLAVPNGQYNMKFTFDDDSTQTVAATVTTGQYTVPTNLNRRYIKRIETLK